MRERFSKTVLLQPNKIAVNSVDETFLTKAKEVVEKYIADENFSVEQFSDEMAMSRVQIHRKLRALTDQSASQFIVSLRLQRAVDLMKQSAGTVSEIAYMTGFNTPHYFGKCFRKQFGCSPSEYKEKHF